MTYLNTLSLRRAAPAWPWIAILASAAMLGTAHAFELFGGLYPCALCLRQREVYWAIIAIGVVGLLTVRFFPRPQLGRTLNVFLGLVFLTGAFVATYHVAVEHGWVMARCEGFGVDGDLSLGRSDEPIRFARCDAPSWSLFGITMAGYNALMSLVLAGLSFTFGLLLPLRGEMAHG
jgi:disulfide bond formation protein DsbB